MITAPADMTPRQIDEILAGLYQAKARGDRSLTFAVDALHRALGERTVPGKRSGWPTTTAEALAACEARGDEWVMQRSQPFSGLVGTYRDAVAELARIADEAAPLNAQYTARRWSRFFTVQQHNGHIHSSMNCSTCNRGEFATQFGWNPELSGCSMADAIAVLGRNAHVLCSVCFPDAPVEWRTPAPKLTAAEKAAAKTAAEAQARQDDPKLISAPDGSRLKVDGDVLKTVRSAQIAAVDHLWWAAYGTRNGSDGAFVAGHERDARTIAEALAAKAGTTVEAELAAITTKAIAKVRKEMGAAVATAAATRWAA